MATILRLFVRKRSSTHRKVHRNTNSLYLKKKQKFDWYLLKNVKKCPSSNLLKNVRFKTDGIRLLDI